MNRLFDKGAIFAGWVGLGMAVVIVLAFALVVPIQPIVYLLALPAGVLIGWYANVRAQRSRPRWRALANALYAGVLTGLTLAIFYVGVRLLFVYADSGYPDFNIGAGPKRTASPTTCATGPTCTYYRYIEVPERRRELEGAGVTDAETFSQYLLAEQVGGGLALFVLTLSGAAVAGLWQAVRPDATRPT